MAELAKLMAKLPRRSGQEAAASAAAAPRPELPEGQLSRTIQPAIQRRRGFSHGDSDEPPSPPQPA